MILALGFMTLSTLVSSSSEFESIKKEIDNITTGQDPYRAAAIALIKGDETYFYSNGRDDIRENSIVEIGSNTKVFTNILFADAINCESWDLI